MCDRSGKRDSDGSLLAPGGREGRAAWAMCGNLIFLTWTKPSMSSSQDDASGEVALCSLKLYPLPSVSVPQAFMPAP